MKRIVFLVITSFFIFNTYSQNEGTIEALKFQNTDIQLVLRAINQKSFRDGRKINILVGPEVTGLVNLELTNVDWETALKGVLRMNNYSYEWVDKDMIVVTKIKEGEQLDNMTFAFQFANVEELSKQKTIEKMLTSQGRITYDIRTNTVWVIDTRASLVNISSVLDKFDIPTRQVSIEAKVLEADFDLTKKLGIDWNVEVTMKGSARPTTLPFQDLNGAISRYFPGQFPLPGATNFTYGILDATQLKAVLRIILSDTKTKIISMPKISTIANNTATIDVVTEDPVPSYTFNSDTGKWEINGFEWKRYGIMLKVTPQINKEGYVTLVVNPVISDKIGDKVFSSGSGLDATIPILSTQTTETKVMVKDKQTLVIGGLIRDKKKEIVNKIPILGDIPYIQYFFKHKSKEINRVNLLIFITPKIIGCESKIMAEIKGQMSKEEAAKKEDKLMESKETQVEDRGEELKEDVKAAEILQGKNK